MPQKLGCRESRWLDLLGVFFKMISSGHMVIVISIHIYIYNIYYVIIQMFCSLLSHIYIAVASYFCHRITAIWVTLWCSNMSCPPEFDQWPFQEAK